MFVCCECCVLSGRGLCDGMITRPEEYYRLWRVVVCDLETSKMRRLKPATGLWKKQKGCIAKKTNKQTTTTRSVHHQAACTSSFTVLYNAEIIIKFYELSRYKNINFIQCH
jgi:hypothetical protein